VAKSRRPVSRRDIDLRRDRERQPLQDRDLPFILLIVQTFGTVFPRMVRAWEV
jgi:hypothetical protein